LADGVGLHVVDWLRKNDQLRKLPLVVYSAREVTDEERRQLRLGPTEFLTKATVPPRDVEALVHTMLQRYRDKVELPRPAMKQFPGAP
jgi:CheY-like chemotaxis protein